MPQIEEVGAYLKGIWLLILGDRSGFDWLDITAAGEVIGWTPEHSWREVLDKRA